MPGCPTLNEHIFWTRSRRKAARIDPEPGPLACDPYRPPCQFRPAERRRNQSGRPPDFERFRGHDPGQRHEAAFALPKGELFRATIDELSNAAYQRLLRLPPATLREWLPKASRHGDDLAKYLAQWNDAELAELFGNLGGHDFAALRIAFDQCVFTDAFNFTSWVNTTFSE